MRSLSSLLFVALAGLLLGMPAFAANDATRFLDAEGPAFADALALPSIPETAEATGVPEGDRPQVRARLLVRRNADEFRAGVLFDLEPGWHLYWRNPGGTGIAPELGLDAPGITFGAIDWPAPTTFREADGLFTTWGYEGSVLLSAGATTLPASMEGSRLTADVQILACRTQCVPASFALSTPLPPTLVAGDQDAVHRLFETSLGLVPTSAAQASIDVRAAWRDGSPALDETGALELVVDACPAQAEAADCPRLATTNAGALFVPIDGDRFEWIDAQVRPAANTGAATILLDVALTRLEDFEAPGASGSTGGERLRGLIPIETANGSRRHVRFDVPIAAQPIAGASASAPADAPTPAPWLQVFLLAFLGGLILNGMPCVLPVLAIKVVAVADLAGKDPAEVRRQGLAYGAGVLGSMAALAGIVVSLRAAGHSVGWGFQFQEPLFVAVISGVLVTFALNLFGVFEIELGQGRLASVGQEATGARRSFFEGLLAVVLATPCTAPFLGTAVGFAFAGSGALILALFLAIGLGLASPFLLVSFVPKTARFIPRSGPWMNTLRSGLGFALLATGVWLLWVLGQSGGVDAVVATVAMLLLLSFLLWTFGRLQPLRSAWIGRAAVLGITAIALVGFNRIDYDRAPTTTGADAAGVARATDATWNAYSPEAVAAALAEGRPAFVVFTADWCLTCKMNEATVLDREAVLAAFAEADTALFKADWTRRDEGIRRKLAEFDRAGVPLYLLYAPERPQTPIVLSELLSTGGVLEAIASLPRPGSAG